MRYAHSRILSASLGVLVLGGSGQLAGCGDGVDLPGDSVAKVGAALIQRSDFDRVYPSAQVNARDGEQATIASMQILLQQEWARQEAAAMTVTVSDAKVKRAFEAQKDQAFRTETEYQAFIVSSKRSEPMLLAGVRQQLLMAELAKRAAAKAKAVPVSRVAAYYERNRKRFRLPARRDLRVLMTKTEAQAAEAQRKLEGGADWDQIVLAYSKDPEVRTNRGVARGVSSLGVEPLDKAVAAAATGKVSDPVETQYGWFVFEVEKVIPPHQQSLEESTPQIEKTLLATRRQRAQDEYLQDFQQRYRERTVCADDYEVAECSNGPDRNPTVEQDPTPRRASPTTPQQ